MEYVLGVIIRKKKCNLADSLVVLAVVFQSVKKKISIIKALNRLIWTRLTQKYATFFHEQIHIELFTT